MTPELFVYLYSLIQRSYVSVVNCPFGSEYFLSTIDKDGNPSVIDLFCAYSHSSDNVYALYELYIDEKLICRATQPILNKSEKSKLPTDANQLESLIKLCSLKVIEQELESHKNHMMKTFINKQNQKSS